MNQHYNLDDMDYGELAAKMKLIGIDKMRHAEAFAERIKDHIEKLGNVYLAKIAGTSSATGIGPSGFAVGGDA